MKKLLSLCLAVLLSGICALSTAEDSVPWTYAIPLTELMNDHYLLVNRQNKLSSDYVPSGLIDVSVRCTSGSSQLREIANSALEALFADAATTTSYPYKVKSKSGEWTEKQFESDKGMQLTLKSGYRSYGKQVSVYANYLATHNNVDDGYSSPEGASEHQTGLAADVLSVSYNQSHSRMQPDFYETAEGQWLEANCTRYGFIIRYPDGKESITGVPYEPWHLRYVGRPIAAYITRNQLTYEEFYDESSQAIEDFKARGGDVDAQLALETEQRSAGLKSEVLDVYGDDGDAEVSLTFPQ